MGKSRRKRRGSRPGPKAGAAEARRERRPSVAGGAARSGADRGESSARTEAAAAPDEEVRAQIPAAPEQAPAASASPAALGRRLHPALVIAGVFAVALGLRLWHLIEIRAAPFFGLKLGDAESYHLWAERIAAGDWIGSDVFYQAPLYPYFLGVIYALFDRGTTTVLVVQALLGALACVLLADAGRRLFGLGAGLAAGLLLAVYAPALFYDSLVQKAALSSFLLCSVLWLLSLVLERSRPTIAGEEPAGRGAALLWAAAGAAFGLLVLVRENAVILAGLVVLWALVPLAPRPGSARRRVADAGWLVLGMALVLPPVVVRNLSVSGEFHLTTSQFGTNFYIGNNERTDGRYVPLLPWRDNARFERQDAFELARQGLGREPSPAEVSSYWTAQALAYIRENPGDWLALMGRKLLLVVNGTEIDDTEDLYTYAEWSLPLRLASPVANFGLLVPLAGLGIWLTWGGRRRLWLLYLLIAGYASSVMLFFVFGRYRFPLVPMLVLFAAAGLVALPRLLRSRSLRQIGLALGFTALLAVIANWPLISRAEMRVNTLTNIAIGLQETERVAEAVRSYRRALELRADFPKAHYNLATALGAEGRTDEAIHHLTRAVELAPGHAAAHYNLGNALQTRGRPEEAIDHYRRAVELDPGHARARVNLALALRTEGRLDEAIDRLREAVRLDPSLGEAHLALGMSLGARGELGASVTHFTRAVELEPQSAAAYYNLGLALAMSGQTREAIDRLAEAVRLEPDWPPALHDMAWILATHPDPDLRRPPEAVRLAERAARISAGRDPEILDTLAAAYAADRQFERAVDTARSAGRLAEAAGAHDLAREIGYRLELYRRGRPYVEGQAG